MKPAAEWDEDYIMSLPVGEFDWLETKGRMSLDLTLESVKEADVLDTLSKEVSAMANSGGGTLIYGLTDPKPGDTEWKVSGGGIDVKVKRNGTKEWLETVIPNAMEPALRKFNVYAIPSSGPDSYIEEGRALFVIEVPDSQGAPHQAKDYRYYARVASRASPIGHRLVTDIINRRQHPKIEMEFFVEFGRERIVPDPLEEVALSVRGFSSSRVPKFKETATLWATAVNKGRVLAQYVSVFFSIPSELLTNSSKRQGQQMEINGVSYHEFNFQNTVREVVDVNVNIGGAVRKYGPARYDPILPQLKQSWDVELKPSNPRLAGMLGTSALHWTAYADNSSPETGSTLFDNSNFIDRRNEPEEDFELDD